MKPDANAPVTAGSRLGPYEIQVKIGEGGMGDVWKAQDTRLDRSVALRYRRLDSAIGLNARRVRLPR